MDQAPCSVCCAVLCLPIKASYCLTIFPSSGEQPQGPPKSCDCPSSNPRGSSVVLRSVYMRVFLSFSVFTSELQLLCLPSKLCCCVCTGLMVVGLSHVVFLGRLQMRPGPMESTAQ